MALKAPPALECPCLCSASTGCRAARGSFIRTLVEGEAVALDSGIGGLPGDMSYALKEDHAEFERRWSKKRGRRSGGPSGPLLARTDRGDGGQLLNRETVIAVKVPEPVSESGVALRQASLHPLSGPSSDLLAGRPFLLWGDGCAGLDEWPNGLILVFGFC